MLVNHGGIATQPRAPGHDRPCTASAGAAQHGRLSAATRAPGADIPRATPARAPGQYCQSAAPRAPGHGRTLAIAAGAPCRDRLSAALRAPAADAAPAITATAPRQHRPSAAPIATVPLPAGHHRLRQEGLPHTPANPRTHTHLLAHHTASSFPRQRKSGHVPTNTVGAQHVAPVPPPCGGTIGGLNGSPSQPAARRRGNSPSLAGKGPGVRSKSNQAHPAIQVPPHARSCSTAHTGFSLHHPARAPPATPYSPCILVLAPQPLRLGGSGCGRPISPWWPKTAGKRGSPHYPRDESPNSCLGYPSPHRARTGPYCEGGRDGTGNDLRRH